jgi:hypothetical protein
MSGTLYWYKGPAGSQGVHAGPEDVRAYIATEVRKLLATNAFLDALPGYLLPDPASQNRVSILLERLKKIAAI